MHGHAAPRSNSLAYVVPLVTLGLLACGGGSGDGPTSPSVGTLEITASTSGSEVDADGYALTIDNGTPQPLGVNGADTVASLSPGTHTVALAGIAANCVVDGSNPRSVDITAATTVKLRFDIACSQPPGAVQVSVVTTGDAIDPDGYQVAVDGGNHWQLAANGSLTISGVSPGDRAIALIDVAHNCVLAGTSPLTVTVASGGTTEVDFAVTCSLTPPGRDIALTWKRDVYLLSADGATFTNLTNNPDTDTESALSVDLSWSPDGQRIAYRSIRERPGPLAGYISVMNADGSGKTQLTNFDGRYYGEPAWSPDGSKIALTSSAGTSDLEIWVMQPDGSGMSQLTHTGFAVDPDWSPDGTRITFTAHGPFEFDIFVMNADGSDVTRLTTDPASDGGAVWSPDGSQIAFSNSRGGIYQVYVMNADGTRVTQLTFGPSTNSAPAWSPDGSKIAFVSERMGTSRLYMMNPDGTDQVPLTSDMEGLGAPAWRP
jgi:Tol biopolymer transport system component